MADRTNRRTLWRFLPVVLLLLMAAAVGVGGIAVAGVPPKSIPTQQKDQGASKAPTNQNNVLVLDGHLTGSAEQQKGTARIEPADVQEHTLDMTALGLRPLQGPMPKKPEQDTTGMGYLNAIMVASPDVVSQTTANAIGTLLANFNPTELVTYYLNGVVAGTFAANANGVVAVAISTGSGLGYITFEGIGQTSGKRAGTVAQVLDNAPYVPGYAAAPHSVNTTASGAFYAYGFRWTPNSVVNLFRNGISLGPAATSAAGRFFLLITPANGGDTSAVYSAITNTLVISMSGSSVEERADAGTPPLGDQNVSRVLVDRPVYSSTTGASIGMVGEGFVPGETVTISGCASGSAPADVNGALGATITFPPGAGIAQCVFTGTSGRVGRGSAEGNTNAKNAPSAINVPSSLPQGAASFAILFNRLLPNQTGQIYIDGVAGPAASTNASGYGSALLTAPVAIGVHSVAFIGSSGQVAIAPLNIITPTGATPTPTLAVPTGTNTPAPPTGTNTPVGATATATICPPSVPFQEIEPNNAITQANAINVPYVVGLEVRGGITPAGDQDFFSFTATTGDRVWAYINTSNASPSTDSILTLLNSAGTVIQLDDDNGFQSTLSSAIAGGVITQTGTYYIAVRQFGGATVMSPYSLYINRSAPGTVPEVEPNDTLATANLYSFGTVVTGSIPISTDLDFYTFTLAQNDVVVIQVDGDPDRNGTNLSRVNQFNPNFDLLDTLGTQIVAVDSDSQGGNGGLLSEALVYTNTSAISTTFSVRIKFDPSTPVEDDLGIYNLHIYKVGGAGCPTTPTPTVAVSTSTNTVVPPTSTRTNTVGVGTSTATATACVGGQVILYDQLNSPGTFSTNSQDFEAANNAFDNQTADDFIVPAGATWNVNQVDAQGLYFNGPGPAASFNVYFYSSVVSGTYFIPGAAVYTATGQSYINTAGVFAITLTAPAALPGGGAGTRYFVSVQARQDFTPAGQWGWTNRTVLSNSGATWRNPGGGFGPGCVNWDSRTVCVGQPTEPDQMFRLRGNTGGACITTTTTPTLPVSTSTRTNTPGAATSTRTNTSVVASPTICVGGTISQTGAITLSDPTQTGRLTRDGVASTCAAPKVCPGVFDATVRHYDQYSYTNTSASSVCVTIDLHVGSCIGTGANAIFAVVYNGSYNPAALCTGYMADPGGSPNIADFPFSFTAAAGQTFVVVIHEITANAGCPGYGFEVEGLPGGGCASPTPGTPVATSTPATATPTACVANYSVAASTGATIVPGTTLLAGTNCDDCSVALALPFAFNFYGTNYNSVNVISNGNLQFSSTNTDFTNACEPYASHNNAIHAYWDDLLLTTAGDGVYTSVSGSAPNRIMNIEWRGCYYNLGSCGGPVNVEARLYEGSGQIDVIYAVAGNGNASATGGVQRGTGSLFMQAYCNGTGLPVAAGTMHRYTQGACGSVTPSPTSPPVSTPTTTRTSTTGTTPVISATPQATATCVPSAAGWTPGANFNDAAGNVRGFGVYFPATGRFYTIGGRNADTAGSDMLNPHIYDPVADSWSTASSTIVPDNQVNNMGGGVLTVSGSPVIVVVGGSAAGATTASNATRYYNPVTDSWTHVTTDPWPATADTLPGGYAVVSNKLYIFGGFTINIAMSQQIWEYDPALAAGSRWTLKTATLPVGRGYIPTAAIGSMIYMAGGSDWDGTTILDSDFSYKYDPATDTITPIATIPRLTAETRAVNMAGKMWVLGGGRDAPNPSNQVDIYDPVANSWTTGTPFITARRNFPADTDGAGKIFITGGYAPTAPTNSTEIYSSGSGCPTPGPGTPTSTATSTVAGATNTATSTATNTATATATACILKFEDVHPEDWFYGYVEWMWCNGIVSGYNTVPPCVTPNRICYKPGNPTTRGQLAKIVVRANQFPIDTTGGPHFQDVPVGHTFYEYVETSYNLGLIVGYPCGGPGEPCIPPDNKPYYRPNMPVTRGQITKIMVSAAIIADPGNWTLENPPDNTFEDVPVGSTFFRYIETAFSHGVIEGYPCGIAPAGPCIPPDNKPYFLPNAIATRAQIAKITYLTVTYPPTGR